MNYLILLLFIFVALGLARDRLGRYTYVAMTVAIAAYVFHAYVGR